MISASRTYQLKAKELFLVFLFFIFLTFAFFGNGIKGEFVYDDTWVISRNQTLENSGQIFKQFVLPYHYLQPETGLYRPLTLISFSLNYLFGKSPVSFHIINILLHVGNSFLVFLLIFKLFNSRSLAYLSGLFFLLMPIHVETVTFISGRADLLAFLFSLLTIWFLVGKRYWISSIMFLLALFSKESALALGPIIVFWLWVFEKEKLKGIIKKSLTYLAAFLFYGLFRYLALRENSLANDAVYVYNPIKFTTPLYQLFTALKVMIMYLQRTFFPYNLSADYSYNQIPIVKSALNPYVVFGVLLLIGFDWLALNRKTRGTIFGFGSLVFLAAYLIISNFIFPIGTIMAERTFYFPSLGVTLITAAGINKLIQWRAGKLWLVIFGLAMAGYGLAIINRNPVWRNRLTLYSDMVKKSPASFHAKANLGIYYIQNNRWDEGKQLLLEVYSQIPDHLPVLDSLGVVAEHEGRYGDAEKFYLRALELRPHYATALSNLGRMYFQLGQYQKSADIYWREFSYHQAPGPLLVYAMSESKLGKYDEAISVVKKYYGENPDDLRLKFALGYAYYKKGDKTTADRYFRESKNPSISDDEFIKSLEKF